MVTLIIYYISKLKDFWRDSSMNAVVVAVLLMLVLSLLRVNIIIALMIGALAGGLTGGLGLGETVKALRTVSAEMPPSRSATRCSEHLPRR